VDSDIPKVLALFFVFGGGFWVLAPLARALAKRISGEHRQPVDSPALEELRDELHQVRGELTELAERLDFTERVLAKKGEADRLQ
jgi:hypothetical protein